MCKEGYFNCNLPCQNPRPRLCLPPHLPQGRSLSEWWRQGKVDAPRIVFSCFFCQWGDCDFLHHLDGRRGQGDHLDPCLTRPVLDLCTCGHSVLKLGCLSKDGWTGVPLYIFHCVCLLCAIVHAWTWFKSSLHLAAFGGRFVYTGPPQSLW